MKNTLMSLAAAALILAAIQTASANGNAPVRPIAKPIVLPKPVANRLIKRERLSVADRPSSGRN